MSKTKTVSTKKDLRDLKKWLNKPLSSKIKLASRLGYSTAETIDQWFRRGQISHLRRDEVMRIVGRA